MRPASSPTSASTEAVDLEIRVTTPWGEGGRQLEYVVHSPSGVARFFQQRIDGPVLNRPEAFREKLLAQLEDLQKGIDVGGENIVREEVLRELRSIGHDLYRQLLPRELRGIYRDVADQVKTLLITSDEPWIPWELLHPHELPGDDFLCMRFEMSRWLTGEVPLAWVKEVRQVLSIDAGSGRNLRQASAEAAIFEDFEARTTGLTRSHRQNVRFDEVLALLEGASFDLFHLAGHGEDDPKRAAEARILLADRSLRVRHLSPEAEKNLRDQRPFVFLNSCQVGRLGSSLTSVDGWAERWVRRCGCTAFLAPVWSVRDSRAARFAQLVYENLYAGSPLARSVLLARHEMRNEEPGDMAWLAYSLYGAPTARILFGDHRPEALPERSTLPNNVPPPDRSTQVSGRSQVKESRTPDVFRNPTTPSGRNRLLVTLGGAAAVLLVALAATFSAQQLAHKTPDLVPDRGGEPAADGTPPEDSEPAATEPKDQRNLETQPSGGSPTTGIPLEIIPSSLVPPPPASARQAPARPSSPFPLSAPVPGKIGIIVLDRQTRRPDRQVADAVRAALTNSGAPITTLIPSLDDSLAASLLDGDFSALPSNGDNSPWGVEYLLLATASRKSLPQSSPQLESFSLSLEAQLVATRDKSTTARALGSHTGISVSADEALTQAAERCLKSITETLNGDSQE